MLMMIVNYDDNHNNNNAYLMMHSTLSINGNITINNIHLKNPKTNMCLALWAIAARLTNESSLLLKKSAK